MILPVLVYPHKNLRQVSEPIITIDETTKVLVNDMGETMLAHKGAGLSAIQVGIPQRVCILLGRQITEEDGSISLIMAEDPSFNVPQIYINPEIQPIESTRTQTVQEGCLSFPGIHVWVTVPDIVIFKAQNLFGQTIKYRAEGICAEAILHEVEHMNGKLLIDKASSIKKISIEKKMKKYHNA